MESPLEVLSRAATMIHDKNEINKESSTKKWKTRYLYEYTINSTENSQKINTKTDATDLSKPTKSLKINNNTNDENDIPSPIDMTISPKENNQQSPNSDSNHILLSRPSVITQAPPKYEFVSVKETNLQNNKLQGDNTSKGSISMCDPVIDEHFRRSLGANYMALFNNKKEESMEQKFNDLPAAKTLSTSNEDICMKESENELEICENKINNINNTTNQSNKSPPQRIIKLIMQTNDDNSIAHSVDNHFAKALGDTWKKLQLNKKD